ncbi:Protein OCTOPUS-like protein [Dioscorea alata]|uniref:Protein OCTOPUS-like protein n=1 Tax=Dioscorea alata TaxID=55571 RepID=A0ACB7USD1_DIOAL|nr:Protein OCTOPUS-like protein [Dioscorea alata]
MNGYTEENPRCSFHPKEVIVGICALCLKERLLLLTPKSNTNTSKIKSFKILKKKPNITLDKVFALASFLLEFRHRNSGSGDDSSKGSTASLDDSFISIKFEDNGRASWDHKTNHKKESRTESVLVPTKPGGGRGPRWKNGIGHLLQMPGKHRVSSSGNVRRGWSLRMRRTTTTTTTTTTITTMTG